MKIIIATLTAICSTTALAQPIMDGTLDSIYGTANVVQNTQTIFGDSDIGMPDFANGSEINAGHAIIDNGILYIMLPGNLESVFNKIDIFIDARDGGQNTLRNDNPDVDFDGLNRMGDDGSGNGLTFDAGFDADMWLSMTCGGDVFATYATYAELHTTGGGFGMFVGSGASGADGVIVGKIGMELALDNSNTAGVGFGEGVGCGEGVTTGIEIAIPLYLFDWDGAAGDITSAKICAFINNGGHDYMSNQLIGGIGGGGSLGDPRFVNLENIPGNQHFSIGDVAEPCPDPSGACCLDISCSDISETDCLALGGEYKGDGSFCNGDPAPCAPEPCEGDINGDGSVDVADVLTVIGNWGCAQ
ncbi:MAG: hypothetical protein CMJ26_03355 [Phycisphaerae bacterium]|nr:hypothetical protein [Phycisphaerae bacterium]|tara:strand:+ start:3146 stop:4222 length:1077 start_codon:yes stop_codon:yes gene_type:complete